MGAGLPLKPFADDLGIIEGSTIPFVAPPLPARFPYATRSVVARLGDGSLWVHSPVRLTEPIREALSRLGPVRHLVSPNKLHHLALGSWAEAFPEASLYAPPGLPRKRPDLRFDGVLGDAPEPAWAGDLDQCLVKGSFFMEEVVFFHRRSRTVILGDLIENHDPTRMNGWQRFWARANRMLAPRGETPLNYRTSFVDRDAARRARTRILGWDPQRVVVMHGPNVPSEGAAFLRHGLAWLGPT